jgi:dihydrofolate synthase/folylpolyglutamate synthase
MPRAAEEVIRAVARERDGDVWSVAEQFGDDLEAYPHTNLEGDYQRWNAATATLAAAALGPRWRLTGRRGRRGWRTWTGRGAGSGCDWAGGW